MPIPVQKSFEILFQLIYAQDFSCTEKEDLIELVMELVKTTHKNVSSIYEEAELIWKEKEALDAIIQAASTEYQFDRISRVERNLLRLGAYEMLYRKKLSFKVVIAEAIRLSRKFSSPESANFINAILDIIYKKGCLVAVSG